MCPVPKSPGCAFGHPPRALSGNHGMARPPLPTAASAPSLTPTPPAALNLMVPLATPQEAPTQSPDQQADPHASAGPKPACQKFALSSTETGAHGVMQHAESCASTGNRPTGTRPTGTRAYTWHQGNRHQKAGGPGAQAHARRAACAGLALAAGRSALCGGAPHLGV